MTSGAWSNLVFHFFFFNQVALSLKPTWKILILREMLIIHMKSPGAIFGSKSPQIHFFRLVLNEDTAFLQKKKVKNKVWSAIRCHSVLQWSNYRPFLRTGSVKKFTQTLKFFKKKNYMSFVPKNSNNRVTFQWMCQWNLFFGKTQKFVQTLIDFQSSKMDVNRFILELYDIWNLIKPCFSLFFL